MEIDTFSIEGSVLRRPTTSEILVIIMCGRFALGRDREAVMHLEGYPQDPNEWIDEDQFYPRHNIAPRSRAPVLRRDGQGQGQRLVLQTMRWGVVPHWAKDDKTTSTLNTINARAENLIEANRGLWHPLKAQKRCVVVCEGYYEWLVKGKSRLPHFIKRTDGKLLLLAGLFDSVVFEDSPSPLFTFAIVTTSSAAQISWLHDRMPVVLDQDGVEEWLDNSKGWHKGLQKLLDPYAGNLECYPVPTEVGKVGTESPSFIQPITQRKDGIQAMFASQAAKTRSPSKPISMPVEPVQSDDVAISIGKTEKLELGTTPTKKRKRSHVSVEPGHKPKVTLTANSEGSPKKSKITHFFSKVDTTA